MRVLVHSTTSAPGVQIRPPLTLNRVMRDQFDFITSNAHKGTFCDRTRSLLEKECRNLWYYRYLSSAFSLVHLTGVDLSNNVLRIDTYFHVWHGDTRVRSLLVLLRCYLTNLYYLSVWTYGVARYLVLLICVVRA